MPTRCTIHQLARFALSVALALLLARPSGLCAQLVDSVELSGVRRTRPRTIVELLPRDPPANYSRAELAETERRISNLGIFDHVAVTRQGRSLMIEVREKWTLTPEFDLATGKTLEDLYIALGATEYNLLGTASALSVSVYREQRGLGFAASFVEHESRHHRWAYGGELAYGSAGMRFAKASWYNESLELSAWTTSPPVVSPHVRFQPHASYSHEKVDAFEGAARPEAGHALALGGQLIWDGFRFHDLTPRGLRSAVSFGTGVFLPAMQPRHYVDVETVAALPVAKYTVLAARAQAAVTNRSHPHHSNLLGSIEGVRGLDDARHRNWLQAFANVELRQAIPLRSRLALQFVAFMDGAAYRELDERGGRGPADRALSAGAGARLIPTLLTELLLRVDLARLLLPYSAWFLQFGVSQYF